MSQDQPSAYKPLSELISRCRSRGQTPAEHQRRRGLVRSPEAHFPPSPFPIHGAALSPHVLGYVQMSMETDPLGDDRTDGGLQVILRGGRAAGEPQLHPIHQTLSAQAGAPTHSAQTRALNKFRSIPIRLMADQPDANFTARYQLTRRCDGHIRCRGNGQLARRMLEDGTQTSVHCAGPTLCELAQQDPENPCRLQSRLRLQIPGQGDELSVFEFWTGSVTSSLTLMSDLRLLHAAIGHLRGVPLRLEVQERSTDSLTHASSHYVHLVLDGIRLEQARAYAKAYAREQRRQGLDWAAVDQWIAHNDEIDRFRVVSLGAGPVSAQRLRAPLPASSSTPAERTAKPALVPMQDTLQVLARHWVVPIA